MLRCLIFEDEHLLVVNKPAGLNTHSPSTYAGEGMYEWLRHREPRWAQLAIIHRLDKETSGLLVFGKTAVANRSLTAQFTSRAVRKKYVLLSPSCPPRTELTVRSRLVRLGDKYASTPGLSRGEEAETRFKVRSHASDLDQFLIDAFPITGRTHQIRVHAAENGFPVLGDTLYGGKPASRVCLHAEELRLQHPVSAEQMIFRAPVDFREDPRLNLRLALIDPGLTNAYRLVHGGSDGHSHWYVDRLSEFLLSEGMQTLGRTEREQLERLMTQCSSRSAYHKFLSRQVRKTDPIEASPDRVLGPPAPESFTIVENGLEFELSFSEGYSVGLFLDQRDNRRRLLTGYIGADFKSDSAQDARLLNAFAYTCGFSVAAAKAGYHTTSLDLSRKYLEWGKRNFALNQLDPGCHDFIYGDVFDWLRRLGKKGRAYNVILLDPPTFSGSKQSGIFRAERDYSRLVAAALPLLKRGGILFASTNAADWTAEAFLDCVEAPVQAKKRKIVQRHYVPQPPDFPVSRAEPAYLKTVWLRID